MSKRHVAPKPSVKDAAFLYFSACCKEVAEKPPVVMPKGKGIGRFVGARPEGDATLGKWRCSKCGKKCKVTRQSRPKQEEFVSASNVFVPQEA